MNITVEKLTCLADAYDAIEFTTRGVKAKSTLEQIYGWEHSISRTQLFKIKMYDIPTFVSVHLVRHGAVGQQHYVTSNREDRGGDKNADRHSPVNHMMILNAQHLIDMSRKRLCSKASKETRGVMGMIRSLVEPELAKYMVPNCEYRGGICSEPKPCGRNKKWLRT